MNEGVVRTDVHFMQRKLRRDSPAHMPQLILLAVAISFLVNGAAVAWLCSTSDARCPTTYVEDQLRIWLHETDRHPDSPFAWVTLGGLYESLGQQSKADEAYATALALDDSNVAALLHQAAREQEAGNYEAGRNLIFRSIESQPAWSAYRSWYRLGMLEEAAGRPTEALAAYEASVSLCRTCWRSHYRMALLYEEIGDTERALVAIGEAHRFAPSDQVVLAAYARLAGE